MTEYLATGFSDVDQVQSRDEYFSCLALLDSLPYYIEYKRRSYELLELRPGLTVLEAGCGLGDDAYRIAERVAPGGEVVAVDFSAGMIEEAQSRYPSAFLPIYFETGDVRTLPFSDHTFARCRIDRTLQHVPQPERAVAELVRVLEPGGLLLAYDNDWGTFTIEAADEETTRAVEACWRDSFTNGRIGRDLPDLFAAAGLSDIQAYSSTSVIDGFEVADQIYNLRQTVQKAAAAGKIPEECGRRWIEEMMQRDEQGRFRATLTACTAVGKK